MTQRHVLIISAFVKDGILAVSWNGKHQKAKFKDNTLREMMYGINFQDNYFTVMAAAAKMIEALTNKKI